VKRRKMKKKKKTASKAAAGESGVSIEMGVMISRRRNTASMKMSINESVS